MVKYRIGCYGKNISNRIFEVIFRHCLLTCRCCWSQLVSKSDIIEGRAYGFQEETTIKHKTVDPCYASDLSSILEISKNVDCTDIEAKTKFSLIMNIPPKGFLSSHQ